VKKLIFLGHRTVVLPMYVQAHGAAVTEMTNKQLIPLAHAFCIVPSLAAQSSSSMIAAGDVLLEISKKVSFVPQKVR